MALSVVTMIPVLLFLAAARQFIEGLGAGRSRADGQWSEPRQASLNRSERSIPEACAPEGVDLDVADGSSSSVGPSGCGKSTTFAWSRASRRCEGELRIGDRVVNEVAACDRDVAMVFQNYALYPHLDVRRNLSFGLERRKLCFTKGEDTSRSLRSPSCSTGCRTAWRLRQRVSVGPRSRSGGLPPRRAVVQSRCRLRGARAELRMLHRRLEATMPTTHDQAEAMSSVMPVVMHEVACSRSAVRWTSIAFRNWFVAIRGQSRDELPGRRGRRRGGDRLRGRRGRSRSRDPHRGGPCWVFDPNPPFESIVRPGRRSRSARSSAMATGGMRALVRPGADRPPVLVRRMEP